MSRERTFEKALLATLALGTGLLMAAPARAAQSARVPGFVPSTSGLHFVNAWGHLPVLTFELAGVSIPVGDASSGLCGGMVYTARDYFESGCAPPGDRDAPDGGPLYDYVAGRMVDSLGLPVGPLRYFELMDPLLPDGETLLSRTGALPHGRAWVTIREEWPKIQADLDAGVPAPLGLIQVKSADPVDVTHNHQVLAYGYDLDDDNNLSIAIYDPNHPDDDGVRLALNIGDPYHPTAMATSTGDASIYAFFRTSYSGRTPADCGASSP
jgi:hypothetical protein